MSCSLYILKSEVHEKYYVGSSEDPIRRLGYHNQDKKGYTQRHRPWKIVYQKEFRSREHAEQAEKKIKSWKSVKMIKLVIDGKINIENYVV